MLRQMLDGYVDTQLIYVTAKLGVADALHAAPRTAADLAGAVGADPDALARVLRALATRGVVAADEQGRYRLTSLGDRLRTDAEGSLHATALLRGDEDYAAWGRLADTLRTGQPGFEQAFGSDFFAHLSRDDAAAEHFDCFMVAASRRIARALLGCYDVATAGTIVDVGGGSGTLMAAILGAYPHLRGALVDTPEVAARARRTLAAAGLAARCDVVAGDILAAETLPRGHDIYLLSQILHNCDDARVPRILAACREAMPAHGRLLAIEQLLPERVDVSTPQRAVESDLYMLVMTGGRERTETAYRALFGAAGLTLRVIPTASAWSVLEGIIDPRP